MWFQLFTVALIIAVGLGVGALIVDVDVKHRRRYIRGRYSRVRARG